MKTLEEIAKEIAALSAQLAELGAQVDRYALPTLFADEDADQEEEKDEDDNTIHEQLASQGKDDADTRPYHARYGRKRWSLSEERDLCDGYRAKMDWPDLADWLVEKGYPRRTPAALSTKVYEIGQRVTRNN